MTLDLVITIIVRILINVMFSRIIYCLGRYLIIWMWMPGPRGRPIGANARSGDFKEYAEKH